MISVCDRLYLVRADRYADKFDAVFDTLSPYRQSKILRFARFEDRLRSLAAGCVTDAALKEYGLRERDMAYGKNACGKPYFKDYPSIFFNVTHSGNYALCAVSSVEVGCDAERIGRYREKTAARWFGENECAAISASHNRDCEFTRLWTRKESVLKACGTGIAGHLTDTDVVSDTVLCGGKTYCFTEYDIDPEMCVTVCKCGDVFRADIVEI